MKKQTPKILIFLIFFPQMVFAKEALMTYTIQISDTTGHAQNLHFGLDPQATSDFDASLSESELPPLPPQGIFDARFISTHVQGVELGQGSYTDFRNGDWLFEGTVVHEIRFQPGSGEIIRIDWSLPDGLTGTVEDIFNGAFLSEAIEDTGYILVEDAAVIDKVLLSLTYQKATEIPAVPSIVSPTDLADDVMPSSKLVWQQTEFAQEYEVEIYQIDDSTETMLIAEVTTDSSFQLNELPLGQTCRWRVRAKNGAIISDWAARQFTIIEQIDPPGKPELLFPAMNAENVEINPILIWKRLDIAEFYDVQVYKAGSFSKLVYENSTSDSLLAVDALEQESVYYWRLRAGNEIGTSDWTELTLFKTGVVTDILEDETMPQMTVSAAYPNPFNPKTTIEFDLVSDSQVDIKVYSIQGQLVDILADAWFSSGKHEIQWYAEGYPSGTYVVHYASKNFQHSQVLTLLK